MSKIENKNNLTEDTEFDQMEILVDPGQTQLRIDQFIFNRLSQVSRNKIQNAIDAELITVNSKPVKANYKVRPLDNIQIVFPKPSFNPEIVPQNIPLDIVFEDDHLLIVNKTAGMVVHPAVGNYEGTLLNALAYYLKYNIEKTSSERYGLVHRIDKETSGLLVIAKTDFAVAHISKQFFDHSIEREYLALVWGEPDPPNGTIVGNIGRDPKNRQRMFVFDDGTTGKAAITHYNLVESFYYTSLVKCNLETGRTHQIRVHMKSIGHPLFNDGRYDGDKIYKGTIFTKYKQFIQNCYKLLPRFPLHARSLGFVHPVTKQKMYFEVDPPSDFMNLIDKWRNYAQQKKDFINQEINENTTDYIDL